MREKVGGIMKTIRWVIFLMGVFALWGLGLFAWVAVEDQDLQAILLTVPCFVAAVIAVVGLWYFKRWALWLSRAVALAALAFGIYIAHFAWTFWLFQTPTLRDRILAVLRPQISLYLILPVIWLIISFLPSFKGRFTLPARKVS